jgi:hypothetical protein
MQENYSENMVLNYQKQDSRNPSRLWLSGPQAPQIFTGSPVLSAGSIL